jgi:hypothetical protein
MEYFFFSCDLSVAVNCYLEDLALIYIVVGQRGGPGPPPPPAAEPRHARIRTQGLLAAGSHAPTEYTCW